MNEYKQIHYQAAGGVVVHEGKILVLERGSRGEIRLPKGHVEPGEDPRDAAKRETGEESGYTGLEIVADLGAQQHSFFNPYREALVTRDNHFYLMRLTGPQLLPPEEQFVPKWLAPEQALASLSFEEEREFVRRALRALEPET
ncbi:MAG: NUDIX domain-containing protein [Thermoflexales bacterium]|nr:NUDIX domain-containing protein [Thermoflexales bacterium]